MGIYSGKCIVRQFNITLCDNIKHQTCTKMATMSPGGIILLRSLLLTNMSLSGKLAVLLSLHRHCGFGKTGLL